MDHVDEDRRVERPRSECAIWSLDTTANESLDDVDERVAGSMSASLDAHQHTPVVKSLVN